MDEIKEKIIKKFVDNFIYKDKRDRCYFELTHLQKRSLFCNRLCHNWADLFDKKYLIKIDAEEDVKKIFKDNENCYIIGTHFVEYDNKLTRFNNVFDKIFLSGCPVIILNCYADKFYLETEENRANTKRFIGKK